MRVRIPWTFTILVLLMLVWAGYTAGVWSGLIDPGTDAAVMAAFVMGWVGVLVLAILGTFLLGMYVGHRIISLGDITPFEEEMLRMKEDCSEMRAELKRIRERLEKGGGGPGEGERK